MSSALETRKHRNTPASLMFRRFDSVHVCCGRPRSPLCSATAAAARWRQKATRFDNADWRIIALACLHAAYVIEYRYCTSQVCEIPKNSVRHHSGWFASARRLRAGSLQLGLPTVPEWPGSSRNWPTVSRIPGEAHFVPEMLKLTTGHGYMAVH